MPTLPCSRRARSGGLTAAVALLGAVTLLTVPASAGPSLTSAGLPASGHLLTPDRVRVSTTPDRSASRPLQGATLVAGQPAYIWANLVGSHAWANFHLDQDPTPSTSDLAAPWEFHDGAGLDPATLGAGQHTMTVLADSENGVPTVTTVAFTVEMPSAQPTPQSSPTQQASPTQQPSPTPQPTAVGRLGQWPSAENTGPVPGVVLHPSGTVEVTRDNTVVENLHVRGIIKIKANNVTVRNVRVSTNTNAFAIRVYKGFGGTLIENTKVELGVNGRDAHAAVNVGGDFLGVFGKKPGDNITMRRCHITGFGDGISASNWSLYEDNYIKVSRSPRSRNHVDGIQISGRSGIVVRGNYIDQAYAPGHNAAVFVQAFQGKRDRVTKDIEVSGNWLGGGVYTFHSEDGKGSRGGYLQNVRVFDNTFDRSFKYGVAHTAAGVTGNLGVWADTDKPLR